MSKKKLGLLENRELLTSATSEVAEVKKNFFFFNITYIWRLFVKTIFFFRKSVSALCDDTITEGLLNPRQKSQQRGATYDYSFPRTTTKEKSYKAEPHAGYF